MTTREENMRKAKYLDSIADHVPHMHKALNSVRGLDYDEKQDIVSQCVENVLRLKTHNKIKVSGMRAFMCKAVLFTALEYKKAIAKRAKTMKRLPDEEIDSFIKVHTHETQTQLSECPFCHKGILNQFGACALCNTIVPKSFTIGRVHVREEMLSVAVDMEYEKKADIKRAMMKLTPEEQQVVNAVIMENETYASLSAICGGSVGTLHNRWVSARAKLQGYLAEYADRSMTKHGQDDIREALN